MFRSSLPHPVADRDYALYEVGEGCEVTNLVPGIDLLSERSVYVLLPVTFLKFRKHVLCCIKLNKRLTTQRFVGC